MRCCRCPAIGGYFFVYGRECVRCSETRSSAVCVFFFLLSISVPAWLAGWLAVYALLLFVMMMMITITIIRNNLNTFVVGNGAPFYSYSTENIFIDGWAPQNELKWRKRATESRRGGQQGKQRWHIIDVHHQWRRLGIGEWATSSVTESGGGGTWVWGGLETVAMS